MSEQQLAQLNEFNSEYKGNGNDIESLVPSINRSSNVNATVSEEPGDITKPCPEYLRTIFKQDESSQFEPSGEVSDISNALIKEYDVGGATLSDLSAGVWPTTANTQQLAKREDSIEEEMELLKLLESKSETPYFDSTVCPQSELPSTVYHIVKCSYCKSLFDNISFESHVCQYDKRQIAITPPVTSTPIVKQLKEDLLPSEPTCLRLLRENQIRIRRFLRDELKYDVNAVSLNNTDLSSGNNSSTTSAISNFSNSNKKQYGPHECRLCERKFVHASGLLRHMEKHAMDLIPTPSAGTSAGKTLTAASNSLQIVNGLRVVIKCTLCGLILFEPSASFQHMFAHFPLGIGEEWEMNNLVEFPYESFLDDAWFVLKIEEERDYSVSYFEDKPPVHMKMVILNCILQCEFCDYVFSEVSYLLLHSACHMPGRRFECLSCEVQMRTSKDITAHWQAECVFMRENLKVHHATTQRFFACNVCDNKYQSMDQLHEHRYTTYHFFPRLKKATILKQPCEYCGLVFEYATELIAHYGERHYKKYKRDTGSSGKARQYLCDICGKSYTQSSHLWQHLRFHQGVKPFACKEPGCIRKFTIRPDLNDHIRKCHTGERPYHCLVCGKRFLTGSVFYQHRLIHRGERRYECEECGKRFYRADALKNHQRIHTGEKPFSCLFCTKTFRQRGDRDKHIRARHSHLDANARLMMQMQKLQLESAAAAAAGQVPVNRNRTGSQEQTPAGCIGLPGSIEQKRSDSKDVVVIGNVAFPKSMFESIIPDIDENAEPKIN